MKFYFHAVSLNHHIKNYILDYKNSLLADFYFSLAKNHFFAKKALSGSFSQKPSKLSF